MLRQQVSGKVFVSLCPSKNIFPLVPFAKKEERLSTGIMFQSTREIDYMTKRDESSISIIMVL